MLQTLNFLTVVILVSIADSGLFSCCGNEHKTRHFPIPNPTKVPTLKPTARPAFNTQPTTPQSIEISFDEECCDILSIIPDLPTVDRIKMKQVCKSRFNALVKMHETYQDSLKNFRRSHQPIDVESNLLIIELDDTIINQKTFYFQRKRTTHSFWKQSNKYDLIYNFNRLAKPKAIGFSLERRIGDTYDDSSGMVGIFRKELMMFIAYLQTNRRKYKYDIVLYSSGISDLAIYHAVTIEMYYNFYYAIQKDLDRRRLFEFKFVIGRMGTLSSKSLITLMRMFGSVNGYQYAIAKYQKMVIIDPAQSAVWDEIIPKAMQAINSNASVICYAPSEFEPILKLRTPVELSTKWSDHMCTRRNEDATFEILFKEMQHLKKFPVFRYMRWLRVGLSFNATYP